MSGAKDPTKALRKATGALPGAVEAMSCNQTSYKMGKKAFLYVGHKAMFELEASLGEAESLSKSEPERYEIGKWVTTRFSAEYLLPKKIWSSWLVESHAVTTKSWRARKKNPPQKEA